jgi:GMP synthase-like glutamine amidotransferase
VKLLSISHQADAGPGVFAEEIAARGHDLDSWLVPDRPEPPADPGGFDAAMVFGGAMNVDEEDKHPWLRPEKEVIASLLESGTPLLGVCLGTQLLAEAAGGTAGRASEPEIGWRQVELTPEGAADPLLAPLAPAFEAFQWHSYEASPPPEAVTLARSPVCPQAYRIGDRAWGIQFHAEVSAADAEHWIDDYRSDPDAVRIGVDPDRLRAETRQKIAAWNQLGRELCGRFLDVASE